MDKISRLYAKTPIVKRSNSSLRIQRKKSSQPLKSPADRILFLQRTIGNQALQRLIKSGTLQTKIRIGQPGDKYEQEADRVADAVMRMPQASSDTLYIQKAVNEEEELQRQPIEEEEELQAKPESGHISDVNPHLESQIQSLNGGGRPLSANDRAFFESRLGYDFSNVRLHTDTRGAEVAQTVNAKAFTVGQDVVFGAGQFAPQTTSGKMLLAHEVAHVVQQRGVTKNIQQSRNLDSLSINVMDVLERSSAAKNRHILYEQATRSNSDGFQLQKQTASKSKPTGLPCAISTKLGHKEGIDLMFGVSASSLLAEHRKNIAVFVKRWNTDGAQDDIIVDGYASIDGPLRYNWRLSCNRALSVVSELIELGVPEEKITFIAHGESTEFSTTDYPTNRRAIISRSTTSRIKRSQTRAPPELRKPSRKVPPKRGIEPKMPPPTPEKTIPQKKFICGPNVTKQVIKALSDVKSYFKGWNENKKEIACNTLVKPPEAAFAWDILTLHKNAWIYKEYRPDCATKGADPPCGSSVQVGNECYYAGSPNYVVFGLMCKLCNNHFRDKNKRFFGGMKFTESEMLFLVKLYKLWGVAGKNVAPASAWARAGYHGWPSGGAPPQGDKSNCSPNCPIQYHGSDFEVTWCPYINPYAECGSKAAALESIIKAIL